MKKWFAVLLLCSAMPALSLEGDIVEADQAAEYINQEITLCGQIKQVNATQNRTYLNIGGMYPYHKLSFAIPKERYSIFLAKFGNFSVLQNRKVCAKGIVVQDRRGRPRINVEDPHVLRFMK